MAFIPLLLNVLLYTEALQYRNSLQAKQDPGNECCRSTLQPHARPLLAVSTMQVHFAGRLQDSPEVPQLKWLCTLAALGGPINDAVPVRSARRNVILVPGLSRFHRQIHRCRKDGCLQRPGDFWDFTIVPRLDILERC